MIKVEYTLLSYLYILSTLHNNTILKVKHRNPRPDIKMNKIKLFLYIRNIFISEKVLLHSQ